VGVAIGVLAEADEVEHVAGARTPGGAVATAHLEPERDVVDDRHVREQAVGLEDHPHVALAGRHPGQVLAADRHRPGRGGVEAGQDAQRGRLAAAGGPEQRDELSRLDVQGEPVQRPDGAVDAGEVGQLDGETM
jgi:hypothetical protein